MISTEGGKAAKGKTDKDLRDNGWFVFFAPRDNPQIAGVVFVEHGGHGGTWAAPIAKHVLETFFAKQDGKPLPPPPVKQGRAAARRPTATIRRSSCRAASRTMSPARGSASPGP